MIWGVGWGVAVIAGVIVALGDLVGKGVAVGGAMHWISDTVNSLSNCISRLVNW